MDLEILYEIEEYAALGFYEAEALGLPYPREYGLAYRRLYENMPARVDGELLLAPFEPYFRCLKGRGDSMGGGAGDGADGRGADIAHHGVSYILNPFHSSGLEVVACEGGINVAEAKKRKYPRRAAFIDGLVADLNKKITPRYGYIHSNPDILQVLEKGFNYYKRLVAEGVVAARAESENSAGGRGTDDSGLNFMLAMQDFAAGIDAYFLTVLKALNEAVEAAGGPAVETALRNKNGAARATPASGRADKLAVIRDEFEGCFYEPADSFIGGLLAVNFLWMLDGCDSIGRLDYALGALYEKDVASGKLDAGFARELLDSLWREFESCNGWNLQIGGAAPGNNRNTQKGCASLDGKTSCDGALGNGSQGCNAPGGHCYNGLTRELLLCDARNKQRRPNLALRVSDETPDDVMELALDSIAGGTGKPALYNDGLYIRTLRKLFPELAYDDAAQFGFGGCTETMIPGLSCADSLAGTLNLAHLLTLAMFDGVDIMTGERRGPKTGRLEDFESFEDFFGAYMAQIDAATAGFVGKYNEQITWRFTNGDPKIVRSMFTRDCLANRRSFEAGGARYNWAVVSYDGSTVAIDSLYAVKSLVFEKKSVAKKELAAALERDFAGYEDVRRQLLNEPKFGNDIPAVDDLGAETLRRAWGAMLRQKTARGGRFLPSVILFATYEGQGKYVAATPNGRRAGKPLNDSVGAFEGSDKQGPTALLKSVLKLPCDMAPGTPVLNMRFSKALLGDTRGREGLKELIRTYFKGGGMQMQITALSTEEMRAAQKEPDKYGDLIVRIGGYSEYFVYLSPALQETVIARSEF